MEDPNGRMRVDVGSGRLRGVRHVASPNRDSRPSGCPIDLVVIHGISVPPGEFGGDGIERLFTNALDPESHPFFMEIKDLRVSAHLLIRRDGEQVQFVPFHERAWHAGESSYEGRGRCNDFSIGIELEGTDDRAYEMVQVHALARVIQALSKAYPGISPARVVGHHDIAPGRKTDPGPHFDWKALRRLLEELPD